MEKISLERGVWATGIALLGSGILPLVPNWADFIGWILIGVALALFAWGFRISGFPISHWLKSKEERDTLYSRQGEYYDEVVDLNRLISGQDRLIHRKIFSRCVIKGDNITLKSSQVMICTSATNPVVTVPEGSPATHLIHIYNCLFDRCHFAGILIELTPSMASEVSGQIDILSFDEWKGRQWTVKSLPNSMRS